MSPEELVAAALQRAVRVPMPPTATMLWAPRF